MTPAPAHDLAAGELPAPPADHPGLRLWIAATLLFFIAAAALRAIAAAHSDLPTIDALLRDAREIYLPWLRGDASAWSIIFQTHDAGSRLLPISWIALNGQIDARILALSATGFGVLALALLLRVFSRTFRPAAFAALATASAVLLFSPAFLLLGPAAGADTSTITVALALGHLALAGSARARPLPLAAGFTCGLLNLLNSSVGLAPALALAWWSVVEARRDSAASRGRFRVVLAHAALAVCGITLVTLRTAAVGLPPWSSVAAHAIAWPFSHAAWSLLVWAPAALGIVRWLLRRPATSGADSTLPLLALWAGWMALTSAATGVAVAPAVFATGLIVNAACLCAPAGVACAENPRRFAAAALWVIFVVNALFSPLSHRDGVGAFAAPETADAAALQLALRHGDTSDLTTRHGWSRERVDQALALLRDPRIEQILPASIRAPLKIEWESPEAMTATVPATADAISSGEQLPLFSTWTAADTDTTADHISRPLRTTFPILLFRITGELRPPDLSVTLREHHDTVAEAWSDSFHSPTRWRRVHFSAPSEPFRIVVRDRDAASWIAFTAPVEVGRISWLVGKALGLWPWLLAGGVVAFALAVRLAFHSRSTASTPITSPSIAAQARPLLPWLALAAYGIFLSGHIDTTAGPNDSGGYLNTAKLLARGKITATPPAPLTVVTNAADVAPYVPGTFRPIADGRMAPNYPVGFPLLVAGLAQLMPLDTAVGACLWLHLIAGVVLVQRLARIAGLTAGWAWLAAGIVGLSPVYVFHALQPMSDVPGLVWATAAIYFAWTSESNSRRALLAGVVLAVAVLIRPTNLFCAIPMLICLAGRWRALALWFAGGLPFALGLAWLNHTLYGSVFASGYGDIRTMIGREFFLPTLRSYAQWLPALFTPVVWLGPVAFFLRAVSGRTRLILLGWVTPFLIFYAFYWCTWDHWCGMRFVLPAAPAFVILGVLTLQHLLPHLRLRLFSWGGGFRSVAASVVVVGILLGSLAAGSFKERVLFWLHANREHAVVTQWLRAHAPANAIVLANATAGSVMYYTDLTCLRVDFDQPGSLPAHLLDPLARSGRPVFAVIHPSEAPAPTDASPPTARAWNLGLAGEWRKVAAPWRDGSSIWQHHAAQPSGGN